MAVAEPENQSDDELEDEPENQLEDEPENMAVAEPENQSDDEPEDEPVEEPEEDSDDDVEDSEGDVEDDDEASGINVILPHPMSLHQHWMYSLHEQIVNDNPILNQGVLSHTDDDNVDKCPICLFAFSSSTLPYVRFPGYCGDIINHNIHSHCLQSMTEYNLISLCPICKSKRISTIELRNKLDNYKHELDNIMDHMEDDDVFDIDAYETIKNGFKSISKKIESIIGNN